MIKINLLPFRAERKKENVRRQVSIYILSVFFFLMAAGYFFMDYSMRLSALEKTKKEKKRELASYKKTDQELKIIQKKLKETRAKLKVIQQLEKNKRGPVLLLEELARAVPKEKLWLKSVVEKKGILTLEGSAMDNDTVALFMTNLEKAEQFTSVDLRSTKLKTLTDVKLNVSEFVLDCKIYSFKETPAPTTKKKKRRRK